MSCQAAGGEAWAVLPALLVSVRLFLVDIDGAQAGFGLTHTGKTAPELTGHFLNRCGVAIQRASSPDDG